MLYIRLVRVQSIIGIDHIVHAGDIGKLRIIESDDGQQWRSAGLLSMDDYDLRDAALSLTPDNRLMVLGGAQRVIDGSRRTGTFVSFSGDGKIFTAPQIVVPDGRWLWRVTWHEGIAYGVSYATPDGRPYSALHKSGWSDVRNGYRQASRGRWLANGGTGEIH